MYDQHLYRHSGRFSVLGLLIGFIATTVVGSALAIIYAYALHYIPFIYVNALLTLGFGWVLGLVAGRFVVRFKIRNAGLAYLMTFLAVLVSYYLAWVVWLAAHLVAAGMDVSAPALAQHPKTVWKLVLLFNEQGTWSIGRHSSEPVAGAFLAVVWIVEALMIFGAAMVALVNRLWVPFCEKCETWCQELKAVAAVAANEIETLRQGLLEKDWRVLEEAGSQAPHIGTWCTLDVHACPSCGETNTLTLNAVTVTTDKKGQPKTQTKMLINRLLLAPDETQTLLAECERLTARPATALSEADQASNPESEAPPT